MNAARAAALGAALSLLLASMPSGAQDASSSPPPPATSSADDQMRNGVELRRQGNDAAALDQFRHAYEQSHSAIALAQMGFAEQALGQWLAAEEHVRHALASDDPWIAHNRAEIEHAYEVIQTHVGQIELLGGLPGAQVLRNGEAVGTMPLAEPIRAPAGQVTIEVRADGYYTVTREVVVRAGESTRESIDLRPRTAESSSGSTARMLALVSGAGAILFLFVGIVSTAVRENVVSSYNTSAQCPGINVPTQPATCAGWINTASTAEALEVGGFVGAAVLAAAAVMLVAIPASGSHRAPGAVSWACGPGPGLFGAGCAIRY